MYNSLWNPFGGRAILPPSRFFPRGKSVRGHPAGWQSGYAAACKAVYSGSIPLPASRIFPFSLTPERVISHPLPRKEATSPV